MDSLNKFNTAEYLADLFDKMDINNIHSKIPFGNRFSAFVIICNSMCINDIPYDFFKSGTTFDFLDGSSLKVEVEVDYKYARVMVIHNLESKDGED